MIDCTKFVKTIEGKPVAVFGLGLSGLSTVRALVAANAKVIAWDDNEAARDKARDAGADITEPNTDILKSCACLVLAPGVPLHFPEPHQVVTAARKANTEIICDLEILHRCHHGRTVIGITGTNGKSTTTALIHHILKSAGTSVAMGGNIGEAVLDLDMPDKDGAFVIEISSFQMDLCPTFAPDMSVLLNITHDHIDRHGTFENYINAKERIFTGQGRAIISLDDQPCRDIHHRLQSSDRKITSISVDDAADIAVKDAVLYDGEKSIGFLDAAQTLRGAHNHQNIAAAYAVCNAAPINIPADEIMRHVQTFSGLLHRQFQIAEYDGITYINDSKATNVEAASKALSSYKNIYWIAGGRGKGESLKPLEPLMKNIKHTFLMGEAADAFSKELDLMDHSHTQCGDLKTATTEAYKIAKENGGGVILLSPACASYDQFKSYAERGDVFTDIVTDLTKGSA